MKLLDEKGLETVWATCKVKFALVGHTHNYAGSDSAGGPANRAKKADVATSAISADNSEKALSVIDCNRVKESIQMTATATDGTNFSSIAGYGFIGTSTSLMGITKSALEKWLGLGTLAYSSESIPTKVSQLTNDSGFIESTIVDNTYEIINNNISLERGNLKIGTNTRNVDISSVNVTISEGNNKAIYGSNGIYVPNYASCIPITNGTFKKITDFATANQLKSALEEKQNKITTNHVFVDGLQTANLEKLRAIVSNLISALNSSGLIIIQ